MKKRLLLLVMLPACLLPGCLALEVMDELFTPHNAPERFRGTYQHDQSARTWIGSHIGDLIAVWGTPEASSLSSEADQRGWRHYYWSQHDSVTEDGEFVEDKDGFTHYEAGETYYYDCNGRITSRPDGIIDRAEFSGECDYFRARPGRSN